MDKIQMIHPHRKDKAGKPMIWNISPKTAKSGKAARMGFLPYHKPEAPPAAMQVKPVAESATPKPTTKAASK